VRCMPLRSWMRVLLIELLLIPALNALGSGPEMDVQSVPPPKRAVFAPKPEYPYEARRHHLTGSGLLILHINQAGEVSSIDLAKSTGHKILDDAMIRAFQQWRFIPGKFIKVRVPFRYTMNGK